MQNACQQAEGQVEGAAAEIADKVERGDGGRPAGSGPALWGAGPPSDTRLEGPPSAWPASGGRQGLWARGVEEGLNDSVSAR